MASYGEQPRAKYSSLTVVSGEVEWSSRSFRLGNAAAGNPDGTRHSRTSSDDELDSSIASERKMALLSVFFAGCALLVTALVFMELCPTQQRGVPAKLGFASP